MTSSFDLLDAVLPSEGRYCAFGFGRYISQKFFEDREKFDQHVQWLVANKFDVYFGCAKFGDDDKRTHTNAKFFRSLWMDIDCGEEKAKPNKDGKITGYVDQSTGFKAVKAFIAKHNLPRPIVVNSGYGLHFYWVLDQTIERKPWESLSHRLRDLALEDGLIVDVSVFEASRVLRIPGTFNFKNQSEPQTVEVLNEKYEPRGYAEWKDLLGAPEPEPDTSYIPRRVSPLMEAMMDDRIKRFKTIMMKSANGVGCQQLLHCYENQADISYNLWRSALSIATHCVDREWGIHFISADHPDYTEGETEIKAADIGGPHLCTTFERENPNSCEGCPNKGRFKSPIMLGAEIAKAEDFDDGDGQDEEEPTGLVQPMPPLPEPYFRAVSGAIYKKPIGEEEEPQLIYEHNLYVLKRMHDPVVGETALVRLHLPQDGVREFPIPLSSVVVKERLREELAQHGVAANEAQQKALLNYFVHSVKNLQVTKKAEIMRTQFGWADNDTKIIMGDREITLQGTFYTPPSTGTKSICDLVHPKGTLEKWKEVFNMYNIPGLEPNAFAALTGFGSLLLKFTGMSGAMINLIHSKSGSGKSTALYMCNSIIGHPKEIGSIWKDTFNAKMHRLGVMNNFANTIDEITNTTAHEFSDLAYSISQGRGKHRMKSQTNEERVNLTSWQGITLCSSNASFYEKLNLAKDSPDGESMRLLEYKIEPSTLIPVDVGKQMFDHQLQENYGHAGLIFCEWLVNNLEEAKQTLREVQARIDKAVDFSSRERFWSATAACNITGGLIAKNLGLHDYDMRRIYEWLVGMLKEMRHDLAPPVTGAISILGDFINTNINNVLVIDGNPNPKLKNLAPPMPKMEPRSDLHIRYEPDTQRIFVSVQAIRTYCAERQINYKEMCKDFYARNVLLGVVNKRLSKGMRILSPAVRALEFDASKDEFLRLDEQLSVETEDAS